MRYIVLLGDGMADHPIDALGGKTPLQAARKPNMDSIANLGRSGLAKTVPTDLEPGSDVANLSILGYDPHQYYSGRAPLEAASMGVHLAKEDIAFRCNFVTVRDGLMDDYSAGHITSQEGRELIKSLVRLMPGGRLYPGVSYRNLLVLQTGAMASCTPPHDIMDKPISEYLPKGDGSDLLIRLMEASVPVLANHPVNRKRISEGKKPANMIWLWGQGYAPRMPKFVERYNLRGAMISAVDLLKGIGNYAGLEVIDVPGASGDINTNYAGKVDAALNALKHLDFVYLHIEAPDEAGHSGDAEQKVKAIELFDQNVVGPIIQGLKDLGQDWRILLLPDHATPISLRTHTREPVPFAMMGLGIEPDGARGFDEDEAKMGGYGEIEGNQLIGLLAQRNKC
jgi:2,3-bisphosphoglycerate-independent phosphoglycerate mutase